MLRQFLDPRLRYPQLIEKQLGVRVLGVLPEEPRWRRLGRKLHAAPGR
jgi:capsular polysaccharide biosynthesis protein